MLRSSQHTTKAAPSTEELILVLLNFLGQIGMHRVPESELHRLVFRVRSTFPITMRFVQQPIIYSDDLLTCLKGLEEKRLLDELVYVHDGWVPKHVYELSVAGRIRAQEAEDRIRALHLFDVDAFLGSVRSGEAEAKSTSV